MTGIDDFKLDEEIIANMSKEYDCLLDYLHENHFEIWFLFQNMIKLNLYKKTNANTDGEKER